MSQAADLWYIRLPDGRILRAAGTAVVRRHLGAGRIPAGSTVRRSPDEDWVALTWTPEFADLVGAPRGDNGPLAGPSRARGATDASGPPTTITSRLDTQQLRQVGVRVLLQELLGALDSSLVRKKLEVTVLAGLCLGILLAAGRFFAPTLVGPRAPLAWCLLAAALVVVALMDTLLSQMTYVELSRLRPARWRETLAGLRRFTLRVAVALGLVGGGVLGLIALLRWLPPWLLSGGVETRSPWEAVAMVSVIFAILLEVALWPILVFVLLLTPLLVVEECSVWSALRQWLRLLRRHLGPALLYEGMAAGLGLVVALPFVFPLLLLGPVHGDDRLAFTARFTRDILAGLALAPLLAYLMVANVFIYLNLRYEVDSRK